MSIEANKAVIHRLFDEVFNQGKIEVLDDIIDEHVLHHDATSPEPKHESPESFKQVTLLFQAAFPDANIPLFDLIAEGDRVVARIKARSWMSHQPINR